MQFLNVIRFFFIIFAIKLSVYYNLITVIFDFFNFIFILHLVELVRIKNTFKDFHFSFKQNIFDFGKNITMIMVMMMRMKCIFEKEIKTEPISYNLGAVYKQNTFFSIF